MDYAKKSYKGVNMDKLIINYDGDKLDNVTNKMFLNNEIQEVINYSIQGDNIVYDIGGLLPFEKKFEEGIGYNDIRDILRYYIDLIDNMKRYMIFNDLIDLDINKLFYDNSNIKLLIDPSCKSNKDVASLFRQIISNHRVTIDGYEGRVIELNNIFMSEEYDIANIKDIIGYSHDTTNGALKNKSMVGSIENQEIKNLDNSKTKRKNKKSYLDKIVDVFSKKEYRVKSLNLDIRIPKK